jgi:uncharacterized protein YdeI (YjbR/CyaY-like superfamily)
VGRYILSYTTASLSVYEMEVIAQLYLEIGDWDSVARQVIEENALQKGTVASRKRLFNELKKRLQTLTNTQLAFFSEASSSDAKNLAMLSCFKLYGFIYDFATEVMRKKLLLFDYQLLNSDYESFYDSKRVAFENLNEVSESTQKKLKQVMFKMLEQAGFIDSVKEKHIQKPYLSDELLRLIIEDDPKLLSGFLYSDADINAMKERFE